MMFAGPLVNHPNRVDPATMRVDPAKAMASETVAPEAAVKGTTSVPNVTFYHAMLDLSAQEQV